MVRRAAHTIAITIAIAIDVVSLRAVLRAQFGQVEEEPVRMVIIAHAELVGTVAGDGYELLDGALDLVAAIMGVEETSDVG